MKDFPFKSLIWAVFGLIVIFMFRSTIQGMLERTTEITIYGVSAKVSKGDIEELTKLSEEREAEINDLNDEIDNQKNRYAQASQSLRNLQSQLGDCQEAQAAAEELSQDMRVVTEWNENLQTRAKVLKDKPTIDVSKLRAFSSRIDG